MGDGSDYGSFANSPLFAPITASNFTPTLSDNLTPIASYTAPATPLSSGGGLFNDIMTGVNAGTNILTNYYTGQATIAQAQRLANTAQAQVNTLIPYNYGNAAITPVQALLQGQNSGVVNAGAKVTLSSGLLPWILGGGLAVLVLVTSKK